MKTCFTISISLLLMLAVFCPELTAQTPSKQQQLSELKKKQILVAMWGWEPEVMAPSAVAQGYEVINQPQGSDIAQHAVDIPIWRAAGLEMLVRPDLYRVVDPFDPRQVKAGYANLKGVILFHERNNPSAVGYVIQWGLFGEGGFQWHYEFSDKARQAFNQHMNTPGEPLPEGPKQGQPGSMRWIKWLEFRSAFLRDFRKDFLAYAKRYTDKLVGTWSEVYPTEHYVLNMGEAPNADFLFYDLSFGDVTCNQRIAFGESHGGMEAFPDFKSWLNNELPLMAKGAGEGVTPMAFQFPMREGHEVENIGGRKQYTITNIEEEYSLKLGPYIRELIDAVAHPLPEPEVALVYHSFQASALPAGPLDKTFANSVMPLYRVHSKAIEGALHQMGVHMRAIPYEWLEDHDLSQYKLVIIPDPMYLSTEMHKNLGKARCVLYSGEFLLAHRAVNTQQGSYLSEFSASLEDDTYGPIDYLKNDSAVVEVNTHNNLMKGVVFPKDRRYPSDQMLVMHQLPKDAQILASVNGRPMLFSINGGKALFVTNRAFSHGWELQEDWLENGMFAFLKNLLVSCEVNVPVSSPPQSRANGSPNYGSYGVSGNIAWNTTGEPIRIELTSGKEIVIPKYGWTRTN